MENPDISLFDAIYTQRAIRSYRSDPISDEIIEKVVEAATKAPSGGNAQPWAFVAVRDRDVLNRFAEFARRGFADMFESAMSKQRPGDPPPYPRLKPMIESFEQIPCLMVVCGVLRDGQNDPRVVQGSIFPAVQNLLLAARGLGIGSALTTGWAQKDLPEIKSLLGLPANVHPIAFLPMGYPDTEHYGPTTRRPVEEILHWDTWEEGRSNSAQLAYRSA